MQNKIPFLVLLTIFFFNDFEKAFAQQNEIDSLKILLTVESNDTSRINILNNLCVEYYNIGDFQSAMNFALKTFVLAEKVNYQKGRAKALITIGIIKKSQGNYLEALENLLDALKIREEIKDREGIAETYILIGNVYENQSNFSEALEKYSAALKIWEEQGNIRGNAISYINIGNLYESLDNYPEALKNYFACLSIMEKLGDEKGIAYSYNNIGLIFEYQGRYAEALENYFASLKIKKELGNKEGIAISLINIGLAYAEMNNYKEANLYLSQGLELSKELGYKIGQSYAYSGLSELNSASKNWQKAYENHKSHILYRDSLFNEENSKKIVQQQMQYDFDKQQAISKAEFEAQKVIAKAKYDKQKMATYGALVGAGLILLFLVFAIRAFNNKQKANKTIRKQKEEVEKQKHLVDEKNKEILDSINYAKRLQDAILPSQKLVKEHLPDSFILYKPKDIVAGDFYWMEALKKQDLNSSGNIPLNHKILFAAADCTGHGVPGALVSVVCSNAMNRAVKEFGITDPGEVLDKVRELVMETFENSENEVQDGMDISLCSLTLSQISSDKQATWQLLWAGANNPIWIIKNNELLEIKPDKQPIGKYAKNDPFTTHSLSLEKGNLIYIFTDGFSDQFGGEKGKKFKSSSLKKLLLTIQDKPMLEQSEILNSDFEKWKGDLEQVDDVCMIGVRV
ncbi:MAG: tetratricopeptide repeat protein [Bacteroidota bacterium]|nr:tetratricopeptide repeat protein [Bacteroidota bacterium]